MFSTTVELLGLSNEDLELLIEEIDILFCETGDSDLIEKRSQVEVEIESRL